jgi:nitroimidazol reductase NimA-like FMN-containing flavoprotein (pyridoxamine 5'-phosphate oxidase superfamily)
MTREGGELEHLSDKECLELLRATSIGRIAFVVDDFPVALPVNYRLVETDEQAWILLRTHPGNVIDQAPLRVAFQIDGVDYSHRGGWSVLVRGTLHHLDADEVMTSRSRYDPEPWPADDRDSWLAVKATAISGRRLASPEVQWAFHLRAYL